MGNKKKKKNKRKNKKIKDKFLLDKNYLKEVGQKIIELRRTKGLTIHECLLTLGIYKKDFDLLKKQNKDFKNQLEIAREEALQWWKAELGRAAKTRFGDTKSILTYMESEFNYKIGQDFDEDFGFIITVRKNPDDN